MSDENMDKELEETIMDSILVSMGIEADMSDTMIVDIIEPSIMAKISELAQLGVYDARERYVTPKSKWSSLLYRPEDKPSIHWVYGMIKNYMLLSVKREVDPPLPSVLNAIQQQVTELQWRIYMAVNEPEDKS